MNVHQTLEALGVRPTKRRGQNFLFQDSAASKIVAFAQLRNDASVLEVGPGLGALTKHLFKQTQHLCIVEVEEKFCDYLLSQHNELSAENIINADILTLSAQEIAKQMGCQRIFLVSNAPYSISTELVLWILKHHAVIEEASLLLQRQFAERLAAPEGGKEYGSLSVTAQMHSELELGPIFPGNIFHPSADVESRLIRIRPLSQAKFPTAGRDLFEKVVRSAFSHRRKTLINSFRASALNIAKAQLETALDECNISASCRAESLTLSQFAELSLAIDKQIGAEFLIENPKK